MSAYDLFENRRGLDWFDLALLTLFVAGIYTGYAVQLSPTTPFPAAPSGIAALALLWRRRGAIESAHLQLFLPLLGVLVLSIFIAPDFSWLPKRFTGLIQLTYSLVIGYVLFLTLLEATREQLAIFFLIVCLTILVGCILEDFTSFRSVSDAARVKLFSSFVYDADMRDEVLYGRVRPKFFTSEPSSVTFGYTLFSFAWLLLSSWRFKILAYLAMLGIGLFIMPGPTLLLMLPLLVAYLLLNRENWNANSVRFVALSGALLGLLVIVGILGTSLLSGRLNQLGEGADASSFYRVQGPALVGVDVLQKYPLAGVG
ncbi:MAG: hypothetical protein JOZ55_02615, partial [Alphaproteobacteria bacterium]|nr:hypothetical protein [Alphaproteobacteria bacterium]